MMHVELTRFKVKAGKSSFVDEWMAFLNANMRDVLLTLEDERMYIETIFRETIDGQEFLYWYSVQGDGGQDVEASAHWVDKVHLKYWKECIDPTYQPVNLATEVVMLSEGISNTIKHLE